MSVLRAARRIFRRGVSPTLGWGRGRRFPGSAAYWEDRYAAGGTSGAGSYGRVAQFKAETLNDLVTRLRLDSVIEFGCGDGHQLSLACYSTYIGVDVSRTALGMCIEKFGTDATKSFYLYDSTATLDHARLFHADVALSLDVIYHLIEDSVFASYMRSMFAAADRCVVIFATDLDQKAAPHVMHRKFTPWVEANIPGWLLSETIPNPHSGPDSVSSFFVYEKLDTTNGGQQRSN
jgi:cyclopropane fatty-acyl-phospholipid synthase-like methyltransferase